MTFGERIRKIRIEKNMTQEELAHKAGYKSRSTIAKIEANERDASQSMIAALAEALGVTPSFLMGWEDNEEQKSTTEEPPKQPITDEDIKFALFNGADGVTDEMYEEVKNFADFVKNRKK
jgi:transcriptional regulator with XRE-family HTH domain